MYCPVHHETSLGGGKKNPQPKHSSIDPDMLKATLQLEIMKEKNLASVQKNGEGEERRRNKAGFLIKRPEMQ